MQKQIIIFSILILGLFIFPNHSFAHVLRVDHNIGAVLHIDPDDDPIANEASTFYLEIKDKTGKFKPEDCSCIYIISENGKQIYSDAIFSRTTANGLSAPVFTFVFAKRDVYALTIEGQPTTQGEFQKFTLTYDIRVDKESEQSQTADTTNQNASFFSAHIIYFFIGTFILFLCIIKIILQKISTKKE